MNFDNKVKKILKELYPNDYNFDGDKDKDDAPGPEFDVFDEMKQLVKIFNTYNNIDSAAEVEQKLKELYDDWPGSMQDAVVSELMNMAQQGNPNWDYVANTILSIIVPKKSANDEKDPSPMGATVYNYSDPSTVAMQLVKDYVELRKINIKDAEGIVRLRWKEVNQELKDRVIDALITLSKADPNSFDPSTLVGKAEGMSNVGLLAREILTIILNEDV